MTNLFIILTYMLDTEEKTKCRGECSSGNGSAQLWKSLCLERFSSLHGMLATIESPGLLGVKC